jgi:hypothetical protein
MSNSNHATRALALGLALAVLGLPGCYARATAEPAFVEAEYAPVQVDVYPHTVYEGRVVYLVNDHWYTRDRGRWVYYRVEPTPLYRQRLVVQQAPPARARHAPPVVTRGRHIERQRYPHERREPDRVRERHYVHEAPPAMPRY